MIDQGVFICYKPSSVEAILHFLYTSGDYDKIKNYYVVFKMRVRNKYIIKSMIGCMRELSLKLEGQNNKGGEMHKIIQLSRFT